MYTSVKRCHTCRRYTLAHYTLKQAATRLAVSRSTIYRLVEEGKIRAITPPSKKQRRYSKPDVDRLAKQQEEMESQLM